MTALGCEAKAFTNSFDVETQPNRLLIVKSDASWLLREKVYPMGSAVQSSSTMGQYEVVG